MKNRENMSNSIHLEPISLNRNQLVDIFYQATVELDNIMDKTVVSVMGVDLVFDFENNEFYIDKD